MGKSLFLNDSDWKITLNPENPVKNTAKNTALGAMLHNKGMPEVISQNAENTARSALSFIKLPHILDMLEKNTAYPITERIESALSFTDFVMAFAKLSDIISSALQFSLSFKKNENKKLRITDAHTNER